MSILPEGRTVCKSHPRARQRSSLLPEASKLANESLKAEIEKEIKRVIWVIPGLTVWKASK
jgi:hypothetical protein